jgi:hypothetical protein
MNVYDLTVPDTANFVANGIVAHNSGARKFCLEAQPDNITDLSAITAIYRPGPLKANVHKMYVQAKQDASKIMYDHPAIENVLGSTYGHICLTGDTLVLTENGEIPIKEIVDKKLSAKLPSYNVKTGEVELDEITQFFDQGFHETIIIETEDGKLELTPNHKVMTTRGWVCAGELALDDEILHIA